MRNVCMILMAFGILAIGTVLGLSGDKVLKEKSGLATGMGRY